MPMLARSLKCARTPASRARLRLPSLAALDYQAASGRMLLRRKNCNAPLTGERGFDGDPGL